MRDGERLIESDRLIPEEKINRSAQSDGNAAFRRAEGAATPLESPLLKRIAATPPIRRGHWRPRYLRTPDRPYQAHGLLLQEAPREQDDQVASDCTVALHRAVCRLARQTQREGAQPWSRQPPPHNRHSWPDPFSPAVNTTTQRHKKRHRTSSWETSDCR